MSVRRRAPAQGATLLRAVAALLAVALLYYPAARLGLLLQFRHTNVSPVWPPSGVAVAALLVVGRRVWPGLVAAAFVVNATTGLSPPVAALVSVGNTGEYVLATRLLLAAGFGRELSRITDVVLLTVIGGLIAPVVAATVGTAAVWSQGLVPPRQAATVWSTWWLGDGIGTVVFAPLLLAAGSALSRPRPSTGRCLEGAALATVTVAVATGVFLGSGRFAYVLLPLTVWAAVRFEVAGAAAVTAGVSCLAVYGTLHGTGPFASGPLNDRLTQLQLYSASVGLTALALGAATAAHRESEAREQQRTAELESSNRELGAFAYTVSHDLRAPLRAIHGFARMLAARDGHALSAEGTRHLDTIGRNAVRMARLIDSLLAHAHLGDRRISREPLDPASTARAAAEQMRAAAEGGRVVDISVDEMPRCEADPVLLGQVYENLIGNAVKFTRGRDRAVIEVGATPPRTDSGGTVYFVRDNGIGFDMRYAHKLFGLFQRLHTDADYMGTGAGLAIARRIIDRHGGRIWAEAEPDVGATFYFTLGTGTGR
jgi:signal transduction histidine kinase